MRAGTCVFGPLIRAGCAGAAWMRGGSMGTAMGAGRRCLSTRAGGVRWSGPQLLQFRRMWTLTGRAREKLGVVVSSRSAGSDMRGRLGWWGVWWLFRGFCAGRHLHHCVAAEVGASALQKGY